MAKNDGKDLSRKLIELQAEWKTMKKLTEESMSSGAVAPSEGGWGAEDWENYAAKHQYQNRNGRALADNFMGHVLDILNEFQDIIGNLTSQLQEIQQKIEQTINEKTNKIEEDTNKKIEEFKNENAKIQENLTQKFGYTLTETLTELKSTVENVVDLKKKVSIYTENLNTLQRKYDILKEEFTDIKSKLINFLEEIALYEDLSLSDIDADIEKELSEGNEEKEEENKEQIPRKGQPKTDEERAMTHFGISKEDWEKLSEEEKQEYIDKLPPRGSGRSEEEEKKEIGEETLEQPESNEIETPQNEEVETVPTSETTEPQVKSEKELFKAINDLFNSEVANQPISGEVHRVPEPKEEI